MAQWTSHLLLNIELNIWVNENFDLLKIIEQGGIVSLKIMLVDMFFMYEAVVQTLQTWTK